MKKLLIILLSVLSLTAMAQQKKVAVYVTGQESGINKVLGDQLVAAFTRSGKYVAVERTTSFLAELGKEQSYQRTGAVSDSEIARLGQQFGVQLVCVADVSEVFEEKYVSTRLIDVETAEITNTANASSPLKNMNDLLSVSNKIATELAGKTSKEKISEQQEREQAQKMIEQRKEDERTKVERAVLNGYIETDQISFTIPVKMTYAKAKSTAHSSTLGGYTDWRIPTDSEMDMVFRLCEYYYQKYKIQGLKHPLRNEYYMCKGGHYYWNGKFDWGFAAGDIGYCILVR